MSRDKILRDIPESSNIVGLLYNAATNNLVLAVDEKVNQQRWLRRLYYRSLAEPVYRPFPAQCNSESHMNPLSCQDSPFVIYNEFAIRTDLRFVRSFRAMDWVRVRRFNLASGDDEIVIDPARLRITQPYDNAWVSRILAPWPSGLGAFCKVGLGLHHHINYYLYDVPFKYQLGRRLGVLPEVRPRCYNAPSQTLVFTFYRRSQDYPRTKLIRLRHISDSSYREVPVQHKCTCESHEDVISCDHAPFIIFNEMCSSPETASPDPPGTGMTWMCVRRYNLVTDTSEVVLTPKKLLPPLPYNRASVARILSVWPDGDGAVCIIRLQIKDQHMDYYVYDVSFNDGLMRQLGVLPEGQLLTSKMNDYVWGP